MQGDCFQGVCHARSDRARQRHGFSHNGRHSCGRPRCPLSLGFCDQHGLEEAGWPLAERRNHSCHQRGRRQSGGAGSADCRLVHQGFGADAFRSELCRPGRIHQPCDGRNSARHGIHRQPFSGSFSSTEILPPPVADRNPLDGRRPAGRSMRATSRSTSIAFCWAPSAAAPSSC